MTVRPQSNRTRNVFVTIFAIPAFFYVFVMPAFLASRIEKPFSGSALFLTVFGVFLYLQFWAVVADMAYSSAISLYGLREVRLISRLLRYGVMSTESELRPVRSRIGPIASTCLSYLWTLYGFAIAYLSLSRYDHDAFSVSRLRLFDAMYFSVVTAATVGYGDIFPRSKMAKGLVMLEIFVALIYAVFFFSVLASSITSKRDASDQLTKP